MFRALVPILLTTWLAGLASGQQVIKLTIRPQAEPVPAMRYRLLPEVQDLGAGNAALYYQRAHSPEWLNNVRRHPDYQKVQDWLELPLSEMPRDKVRGLLPKQALEEVDRGGRRELCDWQMLERFRKESADPEGTQRARLAAILRRLDESGLSSHLDRLEPGLDRVEARAIARQYATYHRNLRRGVEAGKRVADGRP